MCWAKPPLFPGSQRLPSRFGIPGARCWRIWLSCSWHGSICPSSNMKLFASWWNLMHFGKEWNLGDPFTNKPQVQPLTDGDLATYHHTWGVNGRSWHGSPIALLQHFQAKRWEEAKVWSKIRLPDSIQAALLVGCSVTKQHLSSSLYLTLHLSIYI